MCIVRQGETRSDQTGSFASSHAFGPDWLWRLELSFCGRLVWPDTCQRHNSLLRIKRYIDRNWRDQLANRRRCHCRAIGQAVRVECRCTSRPDTTNFRHAPPRTRYSALGPSAGPRHDLHNRTFPTGTGAEYKLHHRRKESRCRGRLMPHN